MSRLNALASLCVAMISVAPVYAQDKAKPTGPTPTAYMVSDAHLDTQWNWDIQTTIGEYVWNTLNQNLWLLENYPEYIFNFEGGVKYAWMKEYYPREYELLKKYIKEGRWHISGASWDATDAVVPSVESAIRNIMLGQEYYRNEFGTESTDIFLPDCFGFPYTLPTVASHCGLIGFSSQKLGWRNNPFYEGDKKYPFTVGLWKGVDGSQIMMYHGWGYGAKFDNQDLTANKDLLRHAEQSATNSIARYYGTGDIGGAPNIASVESVEKALKGGDGSLKIVSATSDQIFKDYLPYESHPELPSFDGELLMDVHGTGCYTSQAAMKYYNRQNEQLGDAAERAAVAAELLGAAEYPSQKLSEAWKRFIWHQFHDDLTGTSIPRAYEFSWNDELLSLKDFSSVLTNSVSAVASMMDTRAKGTPVVMYNPNDTEVTDLVEISLPYNRMPGNVSVTGPDGKSVKAQVVGYADGNATILAQVTVPANGFAVYGVKVSGSGKPMAARKANTIENSRYSIKFDKNGDITSLYDKAAGKEMVKEGRAIRLAMFTQNESFPWPAWEIIKETLDREPESITENVEIDLVEDGALRKTIRVNKTHGDSKFTQLIRLYEGSLADRIDFDNDINWQSLNSLLKAEFPLAIDNEKATYDLGLGTIQRGNNIPQAYEVPSHQWTDLTDASGSYGLTVMNDSKYGWDKPDNNTIRLTLLHTPKTKNGYAYQDHQDLGHHEFTYSLTGHAGELNQAQASREASRLNQRIKPFVTTPHKGTLGKEYSLASIDTKDLAVKALKKAESSDEYVVRVYDLTGKGGNGAVTFNTEIISAVKADGTEKTLAPASFSGKKLNVDAKANGLSTYKVRLAAQPAAATDCYAIPLSYDKKAMTWNGFTNQGNFHDGYSYAAEITPDVIKSGNITFNLENKATINAMMCEGDTLQLPAGNNYNRVYLLAAAATDGAPIEGTVKAGKSEIPVSVPSYAGFIGQWGHDGHTTGYLTDAEIAHVGTHRHDSDGDCYYEFTYMYAIPVDIVPGTTEIILPNTPEIVLFAASAVNEGPQATPAKPLFRSAITTGATSPVAADTKFDNILNKDQIIGWSGFVNNREKPEFMVDGDMETKWCDTKGIPAYVDFDLGQPTEFTSWRIANAGSESKNYITSSCLLQCRNTPTEEWKTVDFITGNKKNIVEKTLKAPVSARYVRLLIVQPGQEANSMATRVYEFGLSK
ncbi:MAG: discoidin domain-containing protein [Clostridiales bacterium]|nr:discoidin domain-containing protein [Clostridiales bacterium]